MSFVSSIGTILAFLESQPEFSQEKHGREEGMRSGIEFWGMSDVENDVRPAQAVGEHPGGSAQPAGSPLFTPPALHAGESRRGLVLGAVAAFAVALAVVLFLVHGASRPGATINAVLPADAYADKLPLSEVAMSESTSLSGGKSTFIDGKIKNDGAKTVDAIRVQVLFHNDEGLSPAVETLPLSLIRTHEPYIDTVPVSAMPLKPGDEREFRLVFEKIPDNWNQQTPEIHLVQISQQ